MPVVNQVHTGEPVPSVRVRMYRQGLGDCFLITVKYPDQPQTPRHILIDCGVFNGAPDGKAKIRRLAESIKAETEGHLDALVATHEHWDHVSGFLDAKDIFDSIDTDEVWLAWTENPQDAAAAQLKREHRLKVQAVHLALEKLNLSLDADAQSRGKAIAGVAGFFGGLAAGAPGNGYSERTAEAMTAVTNRSTAPFFLQPGDILRTSWLPDVVIYVLGPPRDEQLLRQALGRIGSEIYGAGSYSGLAQALAGETIPSTAAAQACSPGAPFPLPLQWSDIAKMRSDREFGELIAEYLDPDNAWRTINNDWLMSVARLALQLDDDTNNTSLVLAFELVRSNTVLLFAADAQIGNWKSWTLIDWSRSQAAAGPQTVTIADLLARTVFYKVGHHGSLNATLRDGGLEAMTHPSLVAAIPVDHDFAKNAMGWDMPDDALYESLEKRTKGRLLRTDRTWPVESAPRPSALSESEWNAFVNAVEHDPNGLFLDYHVS